MKQAKDPREVDTIAETIDKARLERLPLYDKPATYHLGAPGMGCAGDPPGYPSYFVRPVYTQCGDTPAHGTDTVLFGRALPVANWRKDGTSDRQDLFRKLYRPLPIDHPRVRAWILDKYSHFRHCYIDRSKPRQDRDRIVIWPVPSYKLRSFHDDERFSDEWRAKEKAAIEQENAEVIEAARKICTPENHAAVVYVREWYHDYEPELELIEKAPAHLGNWWEAMSEKPEPENCPGQYGTAHPVNGSWCQMCGWRSE